MFVSFISICAIFAACTLLHQFLPAQTISGYCCDNVSFSPLIYRLNGVLCLIISVTVFFCLPVEMKTHMYSNFYGYLFGANAVGLTCSLTLLLIGGSEKYTRCVTIDQIKSSKSLTENRSKPSLITRFYLGCLWNPRFVNIDLKMLLYLIGAVTLQIIILSGFQVHLQSNNGVASNAMIVYLVCFSWFLFEYMYCEFVHLYTYDLFAEKVGFKLTWGCLVFYPFFYPIGIHSIVACGGTTTGGSTDISVSCAVSIFCLFMTGWAITRGANMQKYFFRINPQDRTFLFGLVQQRTVKNTHILCSGWWGVARHFNYFGEIIQGVALSLPGFLLGSSLYWKVLPFLYPLYYVALFVTRQIDDDAVCQAKYGDKWTEYQAIVPYRIVPGVW